MRRRILSAGLAVLLGTSLAVAPASSQDADVFTINPAVGVPGDLIATSIDPDVVADACYTTPDDVLPEGGDFNEPSPYGDMAMALIQLVTRLQDPEDPLELANEAEQLGATAVALVLAALPSIDDGARIPDLLEQLLVLTFADVGSMEPVGERSNFDRVTGEGQIAVPDLAPGLWAVAATCVWPVVTEASFLEMAAAAGDALLAFYDGEIDQDALFADLLNTETGLAEALLGAGLATMAEPLAQWVHPFTIPAALPDADPAVAAFCAAIPQLPVLGDELIATLAALPEDDGSMSQDEWAEAEDWDALGAELETLVGTIEGLLGEGDTSRPDYLAESWAAATAPLRQVRDALQAVDFDLSTESGRMIAGQMRDQATAQGDGEGEDPAIAALTEWFLANCLPEDPPPASAPAAQPRGAQPRYTG